MPPATAIIRLTTLSNYLLSCERDERRTDCWSCTLRTVQKVLAFPETQRANDLLSHHQEESKEKDWSSYHVFTALHQSNGLIEKPQVLLQPHIAIS